MATIEQIAARVRALGPRGVVGAMPELVAAVRDELSATVASGTTPEGEAWPMRKKGGRALQNAMSAVHVGAVGMLIVVRLTGVEARHHRGLAKGGVDRPIIPTGALPAAWGRAFKRVFDERFGEAANG